MKILLTSAPPGAKTKFPGTSNALRGATGVHHALVDAGAVDDGQTSLEDGVEEAPDGTPTAPLQPLNMSKKGGRME